MGELSPKYNFLFDEETDYDDFMSDPNIGHSGIVFCRENQKVSFYGIIEGSVSSIQYYSNIGSNGVQFVPSDDELEYMQMWINYNGIDKARIDKYKLTLYNYNYPPSVYYIDYDHGKLAIYLDSNYRITDTRFPVD